MADHVLRGVTRVASYWTRWSLGATRWWLDALSDGPPLLPDLAALARQNWRGRRIAVPIAGRRLSGVLEHVAVDRRAGGYSGRVDLRDVDFDGLPVDCLSVTAADVALTTATRGALVASDVQITGRCALVPFVAWLDRALAGWCLSVAGGHLVEAAPDGTAARLLVQVAIRDGSAQVEVRALRWRRLMVRMPGFLRVSRRLILPVLPGDVRVVDASQLGSEVDFRLSVPSVSHSLAG